SSLIITPTHATAIYTLSPTRRSSDLAGQTDPLHGEDPPGGRNGRHGRAGTHHVESGDAVHFVCLPPVLVICLNCARRDGLPLRRSEEHTSELQSRENLVCRLLLEKKK